MTETPMIVLRRCSEDTILYWAMKSASAGSIWTNRMTSTKVRRPRKRNREIASAARNANARQTTRVTAVIATDHPSARTKSESKRTALKLATEPPKGTNVGVRAVRVLVGRKDELIIQ